MLQSHILTATSSLWVCISGKEAFTLGFFSSHPHLWISSSPGPCSHLGQLEQVAQAMGQPGLNISKLAYSTNTLAILIQCLVTLKGIKYTVKKVFFTAGVDTGIRWGEQRW